MLMPETAKAAPGVCKGDPQNFERFGGQFDHTLNIKACDSHRTDDALRALPELRRWSEAERELMECPSLICDHRVCDHARQLGVVKFAGRASDPFDALCADTVVFLPGGAFEFARNMRDQTGARPAIIAAARGMSGDVIDLAAIDLTSRAVALWRGRAALLGGENILASRPRLEIPLTVHASVLGWLRANREGVFIIDYHRAADLLDGHAIAAESVEHGQRLQHALARPAPAIVVRKTHA